MVQPEAARQDSSAHTGAVAERNRAGDGRRFHEVPVRLAACHTGNAVARRGWDTPDRQTASGLRDIGGVLGVRRAAEARGSLYARPARSTVSFRRSDVGTPVAASVIIDGRESARTPSAARTSRTDVHFSVRGHAL